MESQDLLRVAKIVYVLFIFPWLKFYFMSFIPQIGVKSCQGYGSPKPIPSSLRDCDRKTSERGLKGKVACWHCDSHAGQKFTCPINDTEALMTVGAWVSASEQLPMFPDDWCSLSPHGPRQTKLPSFAAVFGLRAEESKTQYRLRLDFLIAFWDGCMESSLS